MRKDMKSGKNDEAVSPVIGVILMVAITVILAAVIAAFVFGMGTPTKTPMVNMQLIRAQVGTGLITLTHSGGETVKLSEVKLIVYNDANKTIINPIRPFGSPEAFAPGSQMILNFSTGTQSVNTFINSIHIDTTQYLNSSNQLGTITPNTYILDKPGEFVTIEFWYIPSGQMLGKVQGATIS